MAPVALPDSAFGPADYERPSPTRAREHRGRGVSRCGSRPWYSWGPFTAYLADEGVEAADRAALLADLERLAQSYALATLDRLS